jgi:hypothetical protein
VDFGERKSGAWERDQKRAQGWLFGVMRAQTWLSSEVIAEGRRGTEKRGRGGLGEVLPRGEHGTSSGSSWHMPEDAEGEKTGENQEGRRHSASRHRGGQDAMLSLRWFGTGLAVQSDGEGWGTGGRLPWAGCRIQLVPPAHLPSADL